ncbi:universal stress protein [Massilia forsythiae]|uniref:Universal stress protein n=1 Tax=Massilia forsythiae TaxID=2728020 RepID=A0A7Z2VZV4_9BURK|nr:universal stress protein [Massilia forsythiae]QJE02160.1 universal stress protein [Massilia forsythiae]
MYRRILVPTDGTELSARAIEMALRLAAPAGAVVIGMHASTPPYLLAPELGLAAPIDDAWRHEREQQAQDGLAYVRRRAGETGVACEALLVRHDSPHEAIVQAARDRACDLIVMASHGRRGMAARLLGSETAKVLTHSAIPVLVVR